MIVRELVTKLGFQTDEKKVQSYKEAIGTLTKTLAGVTAAAGAAGFALFSFVKGEAKVADESAKLSRQLGITASELEAFQFAENITGATGFSQSLQNVNARLAEAARGTGRAKRALEAYGIATTDANGGARNLRDFLPEIAETMKSMTESQAADLARQIGLTPQSILLMREGSEGLQSLMNRFDELGGGIEEADAQAFEVFNDTITEGQLTIKSIRRTLAISLLPTMQHVVETVRDWFLENRKIIQQRLTKAIEVVTKSLKIFWSFLSRTIKIIDAVVQTFGGWENVLKILGLAFAAFIGIRAVKAIAVLITALKALGVAILTNPAGLLTAALVGLLVVIGLIVEDVYHWIKGNDSLFGNFFGSFDKVAQKAKAVWFEIKKSFFDPLAKTFLGVKDVLLGIFFLDWSKIKSGFQSIFEGINQWTKNLGLMIVDTLMNILPSWLISLISGDGQFSMKISDGFSKGLSGIKQNVSGLLGGAREGLNRFNPFDTQKPTNNNSSIVMNADVNVTVPTGSTQEQTLEIDRQVRDSFMRQLQLAQQNIIVSE